MLAIMRALGLKLVSFGLIGAFNAGVDIGVFFLALATVTSSLVAANLLAWLVAVTSSYVMNSQITFAAESGRRLSLRLYGLFVLAGAAGFAAHTAALVAAAQVLPVLAAKVIGVATGFAVNFTLSRRVFGTR